MCYWMPSIFNNARSIGAPINNDIARAANDIEFCVVKKLFYTVQVDVYSKPVSSQAFPTEAQPLYCSKRKDGLYSYFSDIFDCRFEATIKRYKIVHNGVFDAYLACYYKGHQISIHMADKLIEKKGKSILYKPKDSSWSKEAKI